MLDADGDTVASGAHAHVSKAAARETLAAVQRLLGRASVLKHDSATFELHAAADGWA
ncbi:hypothetical protein [Natronococcus wangiae]|uniref:hypothetical protein n=1 Tax=Natronococcus wangiae TaxID=3068275 RepID=UPI00273FB4BF|nr:hypothetical protein [Natronococcus sp. AD5]